jgi:integrin alpha FG-GAP repeat containing protein 1
MEFHAKVCIIFVCFVVCIHANDFTYDTFRTINDGIVSAYGDVNSDELTDVFILRDNFKTLEVLIASQETPLLNEHINFKCHYTDLEISSVVPGEYFPKSLMSDV